MPDQNFLTPKQVAAEVAVTEETLLSWRKKGLGPPFIRRGQRILYPKLAYTEWYEKGDDA